MASFSPAFTTCRIRPRAPPPVSLLVFVLGVSVIVSAPPFMRFVLLIIYALRQQKALFAARTKNAKSERPTFCELYLGERKALGGNSNLHFCSLIFRLKLVAVLN